MNRTIIISTIFLGLSLSSVLSQVKDDKPIRLTGFVIDRETREPLMNSHYIVNRRRGGVVDANGRFALMGAVNDTIVFSYVGYKDVAVIVSDTLLRDNYLVGIFMPRDTILLDEVVILPRLGSLKSEITALSTVQDVDQINAVNNLSMAAYTGISRNIEWSDPDAQYKYVSNQIKMRAMEQGLMPSDEIVAINLAAGIPFLIAYYLRGGPRAPERPAVVLSQPEIDRMMRAFEKKRKDSVEPADSIRR
jgi:hypothetical protein